MEESGAERGVMAGAERIDRRERESDERRMGAEAGRQKLEGSSWCERG